MLGQRYAYDFVRANPESKGMRFYKHSPLSYLVRGVRLADCYGWGEPIFSPVRGTVVEGADGWPERNPVHLARDLAIVLKHAFTFDIQRTDLRSLIGNFLIIGTSDGYAFFAHAQTGSIQVSAGENVSPGQHLANVGHSGNSTAPHLHFQLMDAQDLRIAQGLECCFREYEVFQAGAWRPVQNGIPLDTERIRRL
jgi:murein DD-endopeptidase MepM/ murein hydrolase activator NlpD